jgi:hypothetical protein
MTWKVRSSDFSGNAYFSAKIKMKSERPKDGQEINVITISLAWCWCSLKHYYVTGQLQIPDVGDVHFWSDNNNIGFDDESRDFVAEGLSKYYPAVFEKKFKTKVNNIFIS